MFGVWSAPGRRGDFLGRRPPVVRAFLPEASLPTLCCAVGVCARAGQQGGVAAFRRTPPLPGGASHTRPGDTCPEPAGQQKNHGRYPIHKRVGSSQKPLLLARHWFPASPRPACDGRVSNIPCVGGGLAGKPQKKQNKPVRRVRAGRLSPSSSVPRRASVLSTYVDDAAQSLDFERARAARRGAKEWRPLESFRFDRLLFSQQTPTHRFDRGSGHALNQSISPPCDLPPTPNTQAKGIARAAFCLSPDRSEAAGGSKSSQPCAADPAADPASTLNPREIHPNDAGPRQQRQQPDELREQHR